MNLADKQCSRAELLGKYLVVRDGCYLDAEQRPCAYDGQYAASSVISILTLARKIGSNKGLLFLHRPSDQAGKRDVVRIAVVGKFLLDFLEGSGVGAIREMYVMHELHPKIRRFIELEEELGLSDYLKDGAWRNSSDGIMVAFHDLNDFVERYRKSLSSDSFKTACKNFTKSSRENGVEIGKFVNQISIFSNHSLL